MSKYEDSETHFHGLNIAHAHTNIKPATAGIVSHADHPTASEDRYFGSGSGSGSKAESLMTGESAPNQTPSLPRYLRPSFVRSFARRSAVAIYVFVLQR